MKSIDVYDTEKTEINEMCEQLDASEAELMEALLEAIRDNNIDIADYM